MKVQQIPPVIFETTKSGFIQILHHCYIMEYDIPKNTFFENSK